MVDRNSLPLAGLGEENTLDANNQPGNARRKLVHSAIPPAGNGERTPEGRPFCGGSMQLENPQPSRCASAVL